MRKKETISDGIISAMIALQVMQHMNAGKGAPDKLDMERFWDEAVAVSDLWLEVHDDLCITPDSMEE